MDAERDPSGVPFSELGHRAIRQHRTSLKWTATDADVIPLATAEMDFTVLPTIQRALIERVLASDLGYIDSAGPLAAAFADFALELWGWEIEPQYVHLATDVATGIVESLRAARSNGERLAQRPLAGHSGRILIPTPAYPGFFRMMQELDFSEIVQLPLLESSDAVDARGLSLDLERIEREFILGVDAFLFSNPANPQGIAFTLQELETLAELAARYGVFVVSDEIHAPLTFGSANFTPFAPLAANAGAVSVTTTSASKGWNIAGAKCSMVIAADDRANVLLKARPPESRLRSSILGLYASVAAYGTGREWLARCIIQLEANSSRLSELVAEQLPGVRYLPPHAGCLAWLDFRGTRLRDHPQQSLLDEARVSVYDGELFGAGGHGCVRLNFACAPVTLRNAIARIADVL